MDPSSLSATEALDQMERRELSSVELMQSCLRQIDTIDPVVNAMVIRNDELALARAAEADQARTAGQPLGALHGLPVAIKDLQPTADMITTYGSPDFADHLPTEDAGFRSARPTFPNAASGPTPSTLSSVQLATRSTQP